MDLPLFYSLIVFAIAGGFTPGPNNLMLMSSGALFGLRRTLPHVAGIQIGFMTLMATAVYGLGLLLAEMPGLVMGVLLVATAAIVLLA